MVDAPQPDRQGHTTYDSHASQTGGQPGLVVRIEHSHPGADGLTRNVVIGGELDLATVDHLRVTLDGLIDDGCRVLHLALAELRFCDAGGLGVFIGAQQRIARAGGALTVTGARGIALRVLTVTGVLDQLTGARSTSVPGA